MFFEYIKQRNKYIVFKQLWLKFLILGRRCLPSLSVNLVISELTHPRLLSQAIFKPGTELFKVAECSELQSIGVL